MILNQHQRLRQALVAKFNIDIDEILATPDNVKREYIADVDIEYPENLHEAHSDYPLAPEAMTVPES